MSDVVARVASLLPARVIRLLGRVQWLGRPAARLSAAASRGLRTTDATIARGPGKGLAFNPGGTFPGYALGTSEPEVQRILETHLRPGSVYFDVGAGVGFLTVIAARLVGEDGRVVAFEPHPPNHAALEHNLRLNGFANVEVVPLAVADARGSMSLHSPQGRNSTSLQVGATRTFADEELGSGEQYEIETISIDDAVESGAYPPPTFVKIDVEGAEVGVLLGMQRTAARSHPVILCELHGTERVVLDALAELGYSASLVPSSDGIRPHVLATCA